MRLPLGVDTVADRDVDQAILAADGKPRGLLRNMVKGYKRVPRPPPRMRLQYVAMHFSSVPMEMVGSCPCRNRGMVSIEWIEKKKKEIGKNFQWSVVSGQWPVVSGQWRDRSNAFLLTDHWPLTTGKIAIDSQTPPRYGPAASWFKLE